MAKRPNVCADNERGLKRAKIGCLAADCNIEYPTFNFRGEIKGKFCKLHADPNMVDVKHKLCEHENCETQPNYNFRSETKSRFCKLHADPNMVDVRTKLCEHENCETRPNYNFREETRPKFCKLHADPNMVDVKNKKCEHENCETQPNYNLREEPRPRFCKLHADPNMIDVKNKLCEHENCETQPYYNLKGELRPRFCKLHADPNMIDVKNKLCEHENCETRPNYNFREELRPRFCKLHADPNMVNVKSKLCEHENCETRANYNFREEQRPRFCKLHADPNMVNVNLTYCNNENCNNIAQFGMPKIKASYCKNHKLSGMIKNPTKRCTIKNCKSIAEYGTTVSVHCEIHKLETDQHLILRYCKNASCGRLEVCNAEGLCFEYCVADSEFKKYQHRKETEVVAMLNNRLTRKPTSLDKTIDTLCNKRRPDMTFDCGTHFVVVEIDEFQHRAYNVKGDCETVRMQEITQALGMPTIFVRYNPDKYRNQLDKVCNTSKAERFTKLEHWIKHLFSCPPNSTKDFIRVLYLFYDGYSVETTKLEHMSLPDGF